MNAGLLHHSTCGQPPLAPGSVTASVTAANGTTVPQTYVTIRWTKSVDEGAGEKDIIRYAIYRRLSTVLTYDEPFASVPAGSSSYSFQRHRRAERPDAGSTRWRRVDCSPATSPTSSVVAKLSFREDLAHEALPPVRNRAHRLRARRGAALFVAMFFVIGVGALALSRSTSRRTPRCSARRIREGRRPQIHVRGRARRSARPSSTSIPRRCRTRAT